MTLTTSKSWRDWPLCRSYSVIVVDRLSVGLKDEMSTVADRTMHWALGALPNGEYEIAGAWIESLPSVIAWEEWLCELKARGVQRIGDVAGVEAIELDSKTRTRGSLRKIAKAQRLASSLNRSVFSALARRRPFGDSAEATSFVVAALLHAQQILACETHRVDLGTRTGSALRRLDLASGNAV